MKKMLLFLSLLPLFSFAQTYKYIGVEDGLSNRRVYCIQKDKIGYMWFLTHEGVDRYNGKEFKQYKLMDEGRELNSLLNLNWLYLDTNKDLWEIGKKGKIFRYNPWRDEFMLEYKLPEEEIKDRPAPVSYSFIDRNNVIWLCNDAQIYLYDTRRKETVVIENKINESITNIAQIDSTHFFIGTEQGIHHAELKNNALHLLPCNKLDDIAIQINELYFHKQSGKLFIGTFERGIFVYDMNIKQSSQPKMSLTDVSITRIKPFNEHELLIATDGAGVYKLNVNTYETKPYIVANFSRHNEMNGNSINDLYIDSEERIWLANYPIGITVRNNRYSSYNWIKHSIGNKQSLINNQVNTIIEDSEGDVWYGTNNGISLYRSKTGQWHSFMSSFDKNEQNKNHIFTTLCEVSPGIIWAGGYSSGIYQINKRNLKVEFFTPSSFSHQNIRPDKYIRDIEKTSDGEIWSGGYYNLKRINLKNKTIRLYPSLNSITAIIEKDPNYMWIGSATGLYLLEKDSGKFQRINMPVESTYIYSLYQSEDKLLYIGTSGAGLLIYDPSSRSFTHYHKDNCALISNNIYTILSNGGKDIVLSTENGLTTFHTDEKAFHNWTKEQGLMSCHFNANSGTLRKNGYFIFGSADGAVEFNKDMQIPRQYSSKMVLSEFKIFYRTIYPGDEDSPLTNDIDQTNVLKLRYNQNIFSMKVSSINYDYPSNTLYSWKLEGFYDEWSRPETLENVIRFTNLNPGEYMLHIRAVSNEDKSIVLEERCMQIIIAQPVWLSIWAMLIYAIIVAIIAAITLRIIIMRKQRKVSDEKINFFINTAHDIRTPLTLIKAPLEELRERETLSQDGVNNMNTALRNVNALLRLTTNLINFEKADLYSSELYISEYELNTYLTETYNAFRPYADVKHIHFTLECQFRYLNVWIDKEKMDSILKNIISNGLKYTPENGSVRITASETADTWSIEVADTGIGIPANEQKKLFKMHFRGSNAINSKVTGSGIGLMLVRKLVYLHKGKISLSSVEHQGTAIKITFRKDNKYLHKAHLTTRQKEATSENLPPVSEANIYKATQKPHDEHRQRLLVVEDNDELRSYLKHTLSDHYAVETCSNGKEALGVVKDYKPELIISDIMMPEMRGDELCKAIKNDIDTSHIPVILLTALNGEKNVIEGYSTGADDYIVKPFNIGILKATVANLLRNRALLRAKYANLEVGEEEEVDDKLTLLDRKFLSAIKEAVNANMDNQEFTVDTLASALNMSRSSLYAKLKALTDQAPGDYIRLIRLKHAATLLKEGKHNITEISGMTGFSDAKYFREVFKKHFKVSPSQYGKGGND